MQRFATLSACAFSLLSGCGGGGEEATIATLVPHTPQTVSVNAQDSDTASTPNWAQALPLRLSQTDASISGTFYGAYYGALCGVIHAQGDDSGTTVVVNGGYLAVR